MISSNYIATCVMALVFCLSSPCLVAEQFETYVAFVLNEHLIEGNGTKLLLVTREADLEPILLYIHSSPARDGNVWEDRQYVSGALKIKLPGEAIEMKKTLEWMILKC